METQLVFFLALTSFTLIANAVLIWFVYRGISGATSKVTKSVSAFAANDSTKAWIASMRDVSGHVARFSETAKTRMMESEQALGRVQQEYASSLGTMDAKLEGIADGVSTNAERVRDAVAKPAFIIMSFVSGLTKVLRSDEGKD
jgi:hypothetical protein